MNAPELLDLQNRQIESAYDTKPYTSQAFSYAGPGHLRAVAHLYGMQTVPLAQARVLELGCASGGNLLPFALAYPDATVVGVDISSVQIAHGRQVVQDLGVGNLQLHALDLHAITADFGQFDYIIVHGVFSWVPPEVKQAILRICRENLSPLGVAYVSYNTYPGWKAGDVVRDAMLMHSHGAQDDDERLARARAMLGLLTDGLAGENRLGPSMRAVVESLSAQSDYYIIHEYLEQFNTPCYLVEFADMAAQAGLAYLGDAEPQAELPASYGQKVQLNLSLVALGQPKVMRQQYLDFAVGRTFRKSLLVHGERIDEILSQPDLARLRDLRFAGYFKRLNDDERPGRKYHSKRNQDIRSTEPSMQCIMEALHRAWPRTLTFDALCQEALTQGIALAENTADIVQGELAKLLQHSLLHYALEPVPYDLYRSRSARILPGFCYLHNAGQDPAFTTDCFNFWHESVKVETDQAQAWLLAQLGDGTDIRQASALLIRALQRGIVPGPEGVDLTGQRNLEPVVQRILNRLLIALRQCGLILEQDGNAPNE